jgi:beta-glucosidase
MHRLKPMLRPLVMLKARVCFCIAAAGLISTCAALSIASAPQADIEKRIDALLAQMTLQEKLGQLQQLDGEANGNYRPEHVELARKGLLGSVINVRGAKRTNELQRIAVEQSRLKIPLLFGFDVIHGYRTIFPVPLAEAASWDPETAEKSASVAAAEASAAGVRWTFAPMVDIARDARWGRIVEGAGEDPYLGSAIAAARVRGFQGRDYSAQDKVVACAKHWVGYGAAEAGRDYNSVDMSELRLREIYLPPFKAALDAGVGTFMSAFNDLNGVPASANPWTLTKILRDEWKFDGFVVSDYESVRELINHGLAADESEAARYALTAGVDMEMVSRLFNKHGQSLLNQGKLTPEVIDRAVRRVLRMKMRMGLFEHPYTDESREKETLLSRENAAAARTVAARSMVLLKNQSDVLPLSKDTEAVALIGPLADSKRDVIGSWSGDGRAEDAVTLLEGVKSKLSARSRISYAKGCEIEGDSVEGIAEAVRVAREAKIVVIAVGESADMTGEAASRAFLDLPGRQLDLVKAVQATGTPIVVVLMNGRPLTINWIAENCPAILETWFAGTQAGSAIADVLFGDVNPGGKLPVTFPRAVGQVPLYYEQKSTGRPETFDSSGREQTVDKYRSKYLDVFVTPLFPFGYGISYTSFRLSNLSLASRKLQTDGTLRVGVEIQNVGRRTGDEVVQLYISRFSASVTQPVRKLRGFQRVTLQSGEKRQVEFVLKPEDLGFYDRTMKFVVEPGMFRVIASTSSVGGLEDSFEVVVK